MPGRRTDGRRAPGAAAGPRRPPPTPQHAPDQRRTEPSAEALTNSTARSTVDRGLLTGLAPATAGLMGLPGAGGSASPTGDTPASTAAVGLRAEARAARSAPSSGDRGTLMPPRLSTSSVWPPSVRRHTSVCEGRGRGAGRGAAGVCPQTGRLLAQDSAKQQVGTSAASPA